MTKLDLQIEIDQLRAENANMKEAIRGLVADSRIFYRPNDFTHVIKGSLIERLASFLPGMEK